MSYLHSDILIAQQAKVQGNPCGDVMQFHRDINSTTIVLADGLGSGLKANIAATLICTRLIELIKNEYTLREAFSAVVETMNHAWGTDQPFAVFTVARIMNSGAATVLSYEMPPPLLIDAVSATIMLDRSFTLGKAIITETMFKCRKGESIMLVSDGITQAGIGQGLTYGWGIEGLSEYISRKISGKDYRIDEVSKDVLKRALTFWNKKTGDDCTVVHIKNRTGIVVNVFTGPPENPDDDPKTVKEFIQQKGIKIVSGGTTAKVVSREMKLPLEMKNQPVLNAISPPSYKIEALTW
jgi:hypothetical protein